MISKSEIDSPFFGLIEIKTVTNCGGSSSSPPITEIDKYYSSDYSFFKDDNIFKSIYRKIFIWISEKDFLCYIFNKVPWFRKKIIFHLKTKSHLIN